MASWPLKAFLQSIAAQVSVATLRGYGMMHQQQGPEFRSRMSAFAIAEALLKLYEKKKLFPSGMDPSNPLAQKWAVKIGTACRKLATELCLLILACMFALTLAWHVLQCLCACAYLVV